jgi:PAS domain S-box-containing protein
MTDLLELLGRSVDAVFAVDRGHRVTFWNPSCEDLTGVSAAKAVGRPCHELLRGRKPNGDALCSASCPVCQSLDGGLPPKSFAMRMQTRDGRKIQLNVGTMLIPAPDDRSWMVVHCMRRGHRKSSRRSPARDDGRGSPSGKSNPAGASVPGPHSLGLVTERELEILRLLTEGLTTEAMARNLQISAATVRNHVQRLMAKLNVHSRLEAVTCARQHDLIKT